MYVYAPRSDLLFWTSAELEYATTLCELVETPGQRFSQNLFMAQPALLTRLRFVFVLLDDVLLSPDFDLRQLLSIMDRNRLSVASPRIIGANQGGGQKFRLIMQAPPRNGSVGYKTSFLEIFACVYTPSAYRALWSLLLPSVNPYGWGYDFWYDGYARRNVMGHAMGIVSVFTASHEQGSSETNVRADSTSMREKWQAALRQEQHFETYLKIPLRKFRLKMRIRGMDWDGAVTGYLK